MGKKVIRLYGRINDSYGVSPKALEAELSDDTQSITSLDVHVHSYGGDVFAAWAMYNRLRQLSKTMPITFYVDGVAASMMSFLMLAGQKVYMARNSMVMLHGPSGSVYGSSDRMREAADHLDKVKGLMQGGYESRTKAKPEKVAKWLSRDTWFTPEEALKSGLIDGIVDDVATPELSPSAELSRMAPYEAYEAYLPYLPAHMPQGQLSDNLTNRMDTKQIAPLMGLKPEATLEDFQAKLAEYAQVQAAADRDAKALQAAQEELAQLRKQQADDRAEALVQAALAANKIPEAQKAHYLTLAKADYDTTKALLEAQAPMQSITADLKQGEGDTDALAQEWDKLHRSGKLEALRASQPERFQALKTAKYGQ